VAAGAPRDARGPDGGVALRLTGTGAARQGERS
jgi:hypothetical protein